MPTDSPAPTDRRNRYARLPLSARRDRRDWTALEAAAWYELYLAAYEMRGRFESLELVRAYLGPRSGAVDSLIERGELAEEDDEWIMPAYFDMYGEDGKLQRKSMGERLQEAADKMARGERLSDAEYAARHRARRDGIPFPLSRSEVRPNQSDAALPPPDQDQDRDHHESRNDESAEDGRPVVDAYEGLYGKPPSDSKERYLRSLAATYSVKRTSLALSAEHRKDPNPRTICGRMEEGLKRGNLKVAS